MARAEPDYLMVGEAARRLGVAAKSVRELAQRGELPVAGTTSAGYSLYLAKDVDELAEKRRRNPPRRGPPPGTAGRPRKKAAKVTRQQSKRRDAKA